MEGTSSKQLLIGDWSNVQIASYCDACSIHFVDSATDCINHIRMLEQSRFSYAKGVAETSSEV